MKNLLIVLTCILFASFTSCQKTGCTDADANNYDVSAKKNNNTCNFTGHAIAYLTQSAANFLVNDGAVSLTFYLDDVVVGSSAANIYSSTIPECGANGFVNISKELYGLKSASGNLIVKDQTGHTYYNTVIVFNAGNCEKITLN